MWHRGKRTAQHFWRFFWQMPMNDPTTAKRAPAPISDGSSRRSVQAASSAADHADNAVPANADDKTVISNRSPPVATAPLGALGPQQLGQSLVGQRLEHYVLDEFVGGGGMGAVFRATDTR